MPLHIWQRQIVDARGFAASGALVEVRVARTNALAELFADRNGETRLPNPMLADSRGIAKFYAEAGRYHIKASLGGLRRVWENVQLGVTLDMINAALFIPQIEQIYERITTEPVRIMLLALNDDTGNLYRSDDDGVSWTLWSNGLAPVAGGSHMMVYHPLTEVLVFGNDFGNLVYSEDFGLTWNNCVTNYPTPTLLYDSWDRANDGFQFVSDYGLIVGLAGRPDAFQHGRPVWSEDGINWFSGESEQIFNTARSGVYHSASGQFFCNLHNRMARTDDGMNYTYALSLGENSPQNGLGYLPSVGRWVSYRPQSNEFVHALDPMSAASWTGGQGTANAGISTNFVTIPARGGIDQHLLVGHLTFDGVAVYRSFDGISWTALTTVPASFNVTQLLYLEDIHRLVMTSGDNTFGGAGRRIRYSDDGGETWTEGTGLEASSTAFTSITPILVRP